MNNDNFTVLVSGGGRCHGVSMCTVWPSHAVFFGETSNHADGSAPLQPRFVTFMLLAFLKTKIDFEREEVPDG